MIPAAILLICVVLIVSGIASADESLGLWREQRARQDMAAHVMLSEAGRFLARHRAQVAA
ncbi:hypothetical protein [Xanthomonas sp. XNM01]|uniref:hypothetical protein n=1 Tax=Xanthomonas sp. XNM01 TaxID=2769289 RepID=UPI00177D998B|nr:hypothetical protein [Xanthomonas sp. XNM01]MBD9368390.1 hypothetical protein [Xanthomonas sp. XNM01]